MNRLPEDLEDALRLWSNVRHHYCGQKVRYVGKVYSADWPKRGDIGVIVELAIQDNVGISPFIISFSSIAFNIQPPLDAIEFLGTI